IDADPRQSVEKKARCIAGEIDLSSMVVDNWTGFRQYFADHLVVDNNPKMAAISVHASGMSLNAGSRFPWYPSDSTRILPPMRHLAVLPGPEHSIPPDHALLVQLDRGAIPDRSAGMGGNDLDLYQAAFDALQRLLSEDAASGQ